MRISASFGLLLLALGSAPGVFAQAPAPAAAPPAAAPTSDGQRLRAYRINPGDELEIYVWGEERLQRTVRVLPDGTFSYPLVGRVDALNKLPSDLEAVITQGLRAQYRDQVPQVTVSVKTPTGMQFSVAGKVRGQGTFNTGRYVNVLEALVMAGGPSDFADVGNVTILRKDGDGLVTIKVRLTDLLKGNPSARDLAGLPRIESGDTVIVP